MRILLVENKVSVDRVRAAEAIRIVIRGLAGRLFGREEDLLGWIKCELENCALSAAP